MSICVSTSSPRLPSGGEEGRRLNFATNFKDNLLRERTSPLGLIPFSRGGKKAEERSLRQVDANVFGEDFETFFNSKFYFFLFPLAPLNYPSTNKERDRDQRVIRISLYVDADELTKANKAGQSAE